ncbi:MAG: SulP family inorganic anion transporter [Bacteriovoracia bacterium]
MNRNAYQAYISIFEDWKSEWVKALRLNSLPSDIIAGLTVAAVALPLNLALAISAGLPPVTGILSAALGGGIACFFGGASLQISAPAAVLNLLVFGIVRDFGAAGAAASALVVGLTQLFLSFALAGKLARYIPSAVIAGFTTGVGVKFLDSQIPELLGFDYKVIEIIQMMHRPSWLHEVSWMSVFSGLLVALIVVSTKAWKHFPAALVAIAIITPLSLYLGWNVARVGEIENLLPSFTLPSLVESRWIDLFIRSIPLAILASVESVLSARAIDRLTNAQKSFNPNLELFGQGLANVALSFFSGMPIAGVIVRSTAGIQSGAKTRLTPLFQAAALFCFLVFLGHQLSQVPLAALAGLLCVIGFRLIDFRTFFRLAQKERYSALAFISTFLCTIADHLLLGLVLGSGFYFVGYMFFGARRPSKEQLKPGIRAVIQDLPSSEETREEPELITWLNKIRDETQMASTAFVHKKASVIGKVVLGEHVHIAAESSVRADEGTPFYIGDDSNIQDGVVIHGLKEKYVHVDNQEWSVYIGKSVSVAHQALVHGPCYIGNDSFVGFKAVVHDAVVGAGCYLGISSVVVGVEVPPGRYVPHGMIVDTAEKAESLPKVSPEHKVFNEKVVEVNRSLAAAYQAKGDKS